MNTPNFSRWNSITLPLVVALSVICAAAFAADRERPNIVFFLIDDCSTHEFGCYGNKANPTPNIDRLAESGIRFNTAWACPLCVPTRALLLSGQYGFKTGVYDNAGVDPARRGDLPNKITPLSRTLQQAGYATFMGGKWHLEGLPGDAAWGFDEHMLYGSLCQAVSKNPAWIARYKGPWWPATWPNRTVLSKSEGRGNPYATWHPMMVRNGEFVETGPDDFGPDILSRDVSDFIRRTAREKKTFFVYYAEHLTHAPHTSMRDPDNPQGETAPGMEANVRYVDRVIGRLVETLKEAGVWENTVLMVAGDNPSPTLGKGYAAAIGAHVPLIVGGGKKWVTWQGETACLTDFADVYPTCMELAGLNPATNRELSGKSFKPLLDGNKTYTRPWIFSYLGFYRMIRDRQWCLDGADQLWRCNESGNPFTFELITKDKEDAEAARGRAGLEKILQGLPAMPSPLSAANRSGESQPTLKFQQLYRMGVEKLMAMPTRKEGPTRAQIAATLGESPKQTSKPYESGAVETVTDIDGNVYQTVRIGSQIWMKENLKTTRLNDGTAIRSISDEAGWRAATGPAWCVYSNSHEGLIPNYKDEYGLLYNGHAVATGKLAPAGWHVPTREEWMEMINHLGGLDAVGAKVKEAGTNHWRPPNHLADNSSGFSARAAGFRHHNGACDDFGGNALFWSSTSAGYGMAGFCSYFAMKETWMWNYPVGHGLSVRCIKDSAEEEKSLSATAAPLPVAPAAGGATEPQELMKELLAKYDASKDGQLDGAEGAKMSATDMARWAKAFPEYASMSQPQSPTAGVRKTATEQVAPTAVPTQADSGNAPETVTDIDGNVYHTAKIGNQVWLKEDLKTTRFNDGSPIPYVTSDAEWGSITTPAYCWYNHDIKHKNDYGALYNFWAAASGKLVPKGWHVPSAEEWRTLVEFVSKGPGGNQPGSRLRERGLDHWIIQNWNATDDYGFSLRGGGYRVWTGYGFDDFGTYYNAFSTTPHPSLSHSAWIFSTYSLDGGAGVYPDRKHNGFSIRCIRGEPLPARDIQQPAMPTIKSASAFTAPTNMVFIPPGKFQMGSPKNEADRYPDEAPQDEAPQTEVTISQGFWMAKYEVTQAEYLSVMGKNPSHFTGDTSRPVDSVTWSDATSYCARLTQRERAAGRIGAEVAYRLPTEAEWEYACRAGTTTRFIYSDDPDYTNLTNYAWDRQNAGFVTHPVGQKRPNPWGLYDMYGNVWEWCQDWYGAYPGGTTIDPRGPAEGGSGGR